MKMKILLILPVFLILISTELYAQTNEWDLTGSLNQPRSEHQAILLDDGRVLIAGGWITGSGATSSSEIYDPEIGEWFEADSMQTLRTSFTMIKLNNGKILAVGGLNNGGLLASSEIYDPETGTWSETGFLNNARNFHATILLINDKVLVVGGFDGGQLNSSEIYDPETGTWSETGFLNGGREGHTLSLLPNETILATGGRWADPTCEIYDPESETWAYTDSLFSPLRHHTTTSLSNNKIIVTGGRYLENYYNTSEIYDPETGKWTETDSLEMGRSNHIATLLPNDKVLVNGGFNFQRNGSIPLKSSEIYDPLTEIWQTDAEMNIGRMNHTSTLLSDGQILTAGGHFSNPVTELYSWNSQPIINSLTGPSEGLVGNTLIFTTEASDPDSDSVSVRFSWGDNDTTEWSKYQASGHIFEISHIWPDAGEYSVTVQVRDSWQPQGIHNSISNWSDPLVVSITDPPEPNNPPEITEFIGPSKGRLIDSLVFIATAIDPDSDSVSVRFSWDNGDTTDWTEYQVSGYEFEMTHTWNDTGIYMVRVQAKDIFGMESNWSDPLVVTISDTTVGINPELFVPNKFALDQNYPNPFNPSTTIRYQLPINTQVALVIYNLMGQKVKTLVSDFQMAGYYSFTWNGRDNTQRKVSSGVYIYRLITDKIIITKKMILLK